MALESFIQIVDNIDTAINSYTDETSHELRKRVVDGESGRKGIVVSNNVTNPDGGKGNGFIVQWLVTGGQKWYPANELNKVNGNLKEVDNEMLDYLLTLYH